MQQSIGLEPHRVNPRNHDADSHFTPWAALLQDFHSRPMAFLTGWHSNGFLIFHLQWIHPTQLDVPSPNQLNQRSPRCSHRSHDVKFVLRGNKFHVMSHLTGWHSNGFLIFPLQCISSTELDASCPNHVDQRSPRCPKRRVNHAFKKTNAKENRFDYVHYYLSHYWRYDYTLIKIILRRFRRIYHYNNIVSILFQVFRLLPSKLWLMDIHNQNFPKNDLSF